MLPSTGPMKASMIRAELKEQGTWRIGSDSSRKLAKKPSGVIKFSDFRGKSNTTEEVLRVKIKNMGYYWGWENSRFETPKEIEINGINPTYHYTSGYADETNDSFVICSDYPYPVEETIPETTIKLEVVFPNGETFSTESTWRVTGYGVTGLGPDNVIFKIHPWMFVPKPGESSIDLIDRWTASVNALVEPDWVEFKITVM